jgi:small subunit ribosomal protein S17
MPETNGSAAPGRQQRVGQVVSARMNKTIVVKVTRRVRDPQYKRVVEARKKFYAHDETNQCRAGDWVRIEETRPLSKLKRWRLVEVLGRAAPKGSAKP